MTRDGSDVHGVLVIDKPRGPTSHDVVQRVRRALGTRRVGHAGTLDPMATGVLVVLAGEATKLAEPLTGQDKRYATTVRLGVGTATLDADGEPTATAELDAELLAELDRAAHDPGALERGALPRLGRALATERSRTLQVPPAFSAIHVDGRRSHELARGGETVVLDPREVRVLDLRLMGAATEPPSLELELEVSKGYYVRAMARDLGRSLGVPAHLSSLRRLSTGPFSIDEAIGLDGDLASSLVSLARAAQRALPVVRLTSEGERRARRGQRMGAGCFESEPPHGLAAWLGPDGRLVALGRAWRVERGFH